MPVGYPRKQAPDVETHNHEGATQGGPLEDYLRLSRKQTQSVVGPVTLLDVLRSVEGLAFGTGDAYSIASDGSMQWTEGGRIHVLAAPAGLASGRLWAYPDASGTLLLDATGVGIVRNYRQTAQTAAIASFNLLTAPTAGAYRISAYIETTALTVAGTYDITIGWTDAVGATTAKTISVLAVSGTGRTMGTPLLIEVASGNVTGAVAVGLLTGMYNVRILAERIP